MDFILVGGVAAAAHGSPRATQVVDIVYRRGVDNLDTLAAAVAPLQPALRGAPPGLPFRLDEPTLRAGLNFTLTTTLGWLDLLGEIAGGGGYEQLLPHSIQVEGFGVTCPGARSGRIDPSSAQPAVRRISRRSRNWSRCATGDDGGPICLAIATDPSRWEEQVTEYGSSARAGSGETHLGQHLLLIVLQPFPSFWAFRPRKGE